MKTVSHPKYFLLLFLACGLVFGPSLRAQEKTSETPAAPAAPAEPASPAPDAAEPAEPEKAAVTDDSGKSDGKEDQKAGDESSDEAKSNGREENRHKHRHHGDANGRDERLSVGSDSILLEGQEAEAVVSLLGSSQSAGNVSDAVVSVIGGSRVTGGTVGDAVVSVLGNTYINAHVRGEVVTVLGDIELGPNAVVDGEVVCVGGQVKRAEGATIRGGIQNIGLGGHHFNFEGLTTWFQKCLMYARPLAFDSRLWWAWCVALTFLALYLLVALVAPAGVVKCVDTLEQRVGSCLLAAVLALLLTPIVYILLAFTIFLGVGIALIPLFTFGLFVAAIFGKTVMLAWLGRRLTSLGGAVVAPVLMVLMGGLLVLLLYTVPILGLVVYKLLGIVGLGVVIYTLILQFKASRAARPVPAPRPAIVPPVPGGVAGDAFAIPPPLTAGPVVISAATLPRVGFWLRLVASFLDVVLIGIVMGMSSKIFHGWFSPGGSVPFWFAVYCVAMWATKGTTIGGIICGLKVVRLDDRPLDWGVAIVRALGGFLSMAVLGLGFIWVAFDDERQSWHDKIAGTTIVRVPKGTALM